MLACVIVALFVCMGGQEDEQGRERNYKAWTVASAALIPFLFALSYRVETLKLSSARPLLLNKEGQQQAVGGGGLGPVDNPMGSGRLSAATNLSARQARASLSPQLESAEARGSFELADLTERMTEVAVHRSSVEEGGADLQSGTGL